MKSRLCFLVCVILCVCTLTSSCGASGNSGGVVNEINQITNNAITIEGTSGSTAYAAAMGLRSAVSVYCAFTSTSGSGFWNPLPSTSTYYTTGSGVIYKLENDGSAFIITNYHVVYDSSSNTKNKISDKIYVYLYGLESDAYAISAGYVGGSANYDIAVLGVEKSEVLAAALASGAAAAVTVGNSDDIMPGETTIAVGNPSATDLAGLSVTKGIVSVSSEYITMNAANGSGEVDFRVIRTDAPVNSGNSGGGMYNERGELIGIVNAKISNTNIENIGYAIPSNVARAIADNVIDYCYGKDCESVMRGLLGITLKTVALSTAYNTETGSIVRTETVAISQVSAGGLADGILKANDVVKSITVGDRTVKIERSYQLIDAMLDVRVGDKVTIVIERSGVEMSVETVITDACLAAY